MTKQPTPEFQPMSQLPLIAHVIDGMLESATETGQALEEAQPKPYVLDDATVNRVLWCAGCSISSTNASA